MLKFDSWFYRSEEDGGGGHADVKTLSIHDEPIKVCVAGLRGLF